MKAISKKLIKPVLLGSLIFGLSACGGGADSSASSAVVNPAMISQTKASSIYFDSFGKIPVSAQDASYWIRLHNNGSTDYTITSVSIIDDIKRAKAENLSVTANCSLLSANGECSFQLHYVANTHGAYRIVAELLDKAGKKHTISQVIVTGAEVSNTAPINMEPEATLEARDKQHYSMALPVYLNQDFAEVKVTNGQLYCGDGSYAGSGCTYFVDGELTGDKLLLSTDVEGFDENGKLLAQSPASIMVQNQAAHLLISNPGHQEVSATTDTNTTIELYNTGNLAAKALAINAQNATASHQCGTEIEPGKSCSITLDLGKKTSNGTASLNADYKDDNVTNKSVATNFSYALDEELSARPEFGTTISFSNMIPGDVRTTPVTLTNESNAAFKIVDIKVGAKISTGAAGAGKTSCVPGVTLASSKLATADVPAGQVQSCELGVNYTAASGDNGVSSLSVTGSYQDVNDIAKTASAHMPIAYSGISLASVLNIASTSYSMTSYVGEDKDYDVTTITNTNANHAATLGISYTPSNGSGISLVTSGAYCKDGQQLAAKASCTLRLKHNPGSAYATRTEDIEVRLAKLGTITQNTTATKVEVKATSMVVPFGSISPTFVGAAASAGNLVTEGSLYGVAVGNKVIYTYRLTNNSNDAKIKIKVPTLADPGWGWKVNSNGCNKEVEQNQTCDIKFEYTLSNTSIANFGEDAVKIPFQYTSMTDGSWQNATSPVQLGTVKREAIGYQAADAEIANKPSTTQTLTDVGDKLNFTVRVTGYNPSASLPKGWTVSNDAPSGLTDITPAPSSCNFTTTLKNQSAQCVLTLTKRRDSASFSMTAQKAGLAGNGTQDARHRFQYNLHTPLKLSDKLRVSFVAKPGGPWNQGHYRLSFEGLDHPINIIAQYPSIFPRSRDQRFIRTGTNKYRLEVSMDGNSWSKVLQKRSPISGQSGFATDAWEIGVGTMGDNHPSRRNVEFEFEPSTTEKDQVRIKSENGYLMPTTGGDFLSAEGGCPGTQAQNGQDGGHLHKCRRYRLQLSKQVTNSSFGAWYIRTY
ncbi:MAG: hypothetical protein E6Q33_07530 [Neisseriales bacterium]|nr:MAG: hypothetical protein E6Q33_07530 [Neisseriales bacterium]